MAKKGKKRATAVQVEAPSAGKKESVRAKSRRWRTEGKAMLTAGREEMQKLVNKMLSDTNKQKVKHREAVKGLMSNINKQKTENREAAKKMEEGVKSLVSDFREESKMVGQYVKGFWG